MPSITMNAPSPGESISEVQIAVWLKKDGEWVEKDATICEIESDKATLTVSAQASGRLKILAQAGEVVAVGAPICEIDADAKGSAAPASDAKSNATTPAKAAAEKSAPTANVGTVSAGGTSSATPIAATSTASTVSAAPKASPQGNRPVRREKMSMLRRSLAQRLVEVKNQTAMLTTFNEVDMSFVQKLRADQQEKFQKKYTVKLGFMSFFVKATVNALKEFPAVNAQIDGEEILYHEYTDIGIAVSAPKGLMVPVIRDAHNLHAGQIEQEIARLATKARENKITLDEMQGGTFTITNGGVFGSLFATPIINPPQVAILGMHNIVDRPVAVNGQVAIRPIMYIALSYDHRIIDGRESVGFLKLIKTQLEDPAALLAGI